MRIGRRCKDIGQIIGTEKGLSEKGGKTRVRRKKWATGSALGRQGKCAKDLRQRSGAKNPPLLRPGSAQESRRNGEEVPSNARSRAPRRWSRDSSPDTWHDMGDRRGDFPCVHAPRPRQLAPRTPNR